MQHDQSNPDHYQLNKLRERRKREVKRAGRTQNYKLLRKLMFVSFGIGMMAIAVYYGFEAFQEPSIGKMIAVFAMAAFFMVCGGLILNHGLWNPHVYYGLRRWLYDASPPFYRRRR